MSKKKRGGILASFRDLIVIVVVAVAMAWALTTWVVQPYEIPSGSMEDTIAIGDRVLSEKVTARASDPEAGDIVTFTCWEDPWTEDLYVDAADADESTQGRLEEKVLIKRVIATGGQTVDIRDGSVWVDGTELAEAYTDGAATEELAGSDIEFPYEVPDGEIWVMGDNRANSKDSRFFGSIPTSSLTGRAVFRYWPVDSIGVLE